MIDFILGVYLLTMLNFIQLKAESPKSRKSNSPVYYTRIETENENFKTPTIYEKLKSNPIYSTSSQSSTTQNFENGSVTDQSVSIIDLYS